MHTKIIALNTPSYKVNTVKITDAKTIKALMEKDKYAIEELLGKNDEPWTIISIRNSPQEDIITNKNKHVLKELGCVDHLTLYFLDIEKDHYNLNPREHDKNNTFFNASHAQKFRKFIKEVKTKSNRIIIHCDQGRSRSVALACVAADMYGIPNKLTSKQRPNKDVLGVLNPGLKAYYKSLNARKTTRLPDRTCRRMDF